MQDLLHVGDSSSRVAEVRLSLARLGLLDGYEGEIDSTRRFTESEMLFDDTLAEALKAFQQSRGILPSGSIDDLTLRELREASYTLGARVLSYQPGQEMVGDDVGQLQTQLHELGFYSNRIDGRFGPATYEALMNYQLNSGLEDDGVCGPDTLHALSLLGRRITGGSAQAIRERETVRQAGPNLAGKRVVIDPDLGGSDKGLVVEGPYGPITEEEILWDLAQRIEGRMVATGMENHPVPPTWRQPVQQAPRRPGQRLQRRPADLTASGFLPERKGQRRCHLLLRLRARQLLDDRRNPVRLHPARDRRPH